MLRGVRQQQDEPGRFSICSRQAAVVRRNGSIHLGRPADKITLRDIYLSVIEDKKLWASRPDVPARCVVSANACWYFKSVADEAEQASLNVLARHTAASALEAVKNADTSGCDPVPEMIARFKKAH
ncbi:Rrf2 family transcriptional regulator [Klebsiella pneumoniae]|uniref:Rrf2 family transcriptional regulator n=1 Tax=Klebsiella pneumoniae TaxID=573 RepID=UPI001F51E86D|nr:Rrf2 family transcriptional regulator [Klebsiella pneumoniae]